VKDKKDHKELLAQGLIALAQSPQYELIRTLEVARLHPKLKSKKGTLESYVDTTPTLTAQQTTVFLEVIAPYLPAIKPEDGLESIKKSEAIGLLEESFIKLKKLPVEKLTSQVIKNFLPKDAPSLPFEEMLNFKQLQEIGLENLVRKKGSHSEKFNALSISINSFISSVTSSALSSPQVENKIISQIKFLPPKSPLSSVESMVLNSILSLQSESAQGILKSLSRLLHEDEIATLLLASENKKNFTESITEELLPLKSKVLSIITNSHRDFLLSVESLLKSPGVKVESLRGLIGGEISASTLFSKFLFLILGATHPTIDNQIFESFYTLSQEFFVLVYNNEKNKGTLKSGVLKEFF